MLCVRAATQRPFIATIQIILRIYKKGYITEFLLQIIYIMYCYYAVEMII